MENIRREERQRKTSNFLIQGSILAVSGIIVRLIGILYRVPLIRIIGDEGMGYYANAFSVYQILLLLSSYSMPLAVSKMISMRIAKGQYRNVKRILTVALWYATVVGAIGAAIVWFGADFFATRFFPMPYCVYALKTLAPTIWIMAYLGVYRGYFQGLGTMVPTAVSQIVEQIINAVVSVVAASILFGVGIKSNLVYENDQYANAFGAAGGTIGTGMGALAALLFLLFLFIGYKRTLKKQIRMDKSRKVESYRNIRSVMIATVIPVILSTAVYNINGILDSSIFGHCLEFLGETEKYSVQIGVYSGKYLLLINVPIAISSALSSSLIPALTRAVASGNREDVVKRISMVNRFAMIVAIPASVGLAVLAGPIHELLFAGDDNALSIAMTMAGSLTVVFYSLSTVSNAILQGINHMNMPIRNALISLVLHLLCLIPMVLVLRMEAFALVFSNMLFAICMCVLNWAVIKRYLHCRQEIKKTFVIPTVASIVMGVVAFGVHYAFNMVVGNTVASLAAIFAAVGVYGILLLKFHGISQKEILSMPKGRSLVRILKKLHLL